MRLFALLGMPMLLLLAISESSSGQDKKAPEKKYKVIWKKVVIDAKFRSEGVGVADINKDGKKDIIVGDYAYLAPDWKPQAIRKPATSVPGRATVTKDGSFDPKNYSNSFAVFMDDIDGDGYPDMIVVGWPGDPCHWYKNPGKEGGLWKEYMIQDNACNETPLYVDLLGIGKKGLLLGHKGEMCFFMPTKDATKPWRRISISGPGKGIPGTHHFAHGLGAADVNGDGKLDVVCNGGWWEQPLANSFEGNWKFHPGKFEDCADMHAFDFDGDGKNNIIASAAHRTGFWKYQQRGTGWLQQPLFPVLSAKVADVLKLPEGVKLSKDETEIFQVLTKARADQKKVPWRIDAKLCQDARAAAILSAEAMEGKVELTRSKYNGEQVALHHGTTLKAPDIVREFFEKYPKAKNPGYEVGIGVFDAAGGKRHFAIILGDREQFVMPGQTHALHFVDINGDGLKDFVTGRRHWAHGMAGDDNPGDPAYLYWFEAKKGKAGTTFIPHMIDDDSGVGTQFAVEDVNGDGLLDVVISNKRGVFLFLQDREVIIPPLQLPDDN